MAEGESLIRDPEGGGNQVGLRHQNERLVLSFIRRYGAMASAEVARRSGLSAQTVSNIVRDLELRGLLQRGEAIKGKVGKPSVPVTLNPNGAFSLGLNIGRRSAELVLVDFLGQQVGQRTTTYNYPIIDDVFRFLTEGIDQLFAAHPHARTNVSGLGVGQPNKIWDWLEIVDAPEGAMRAWQDIDLKDALTRATGLEVVIENDATSACVAEQLLGRGSEFSDFAYIFVGSFVGGGLVLNNKVFTGATGNAAAIGPLLVPDGSGGVTQLLSVASVHVLERALAQAGEDHASLRGARNSWDPFEPWVAPWLKQTAANLAIAAASIAAVIEIEALLIDGAMPAPVRARLVEMTAERFAHYDVTGIEKPAIREATVGRTARSVGAALLPIHSKYFIA